MLLSQFEGRFPTEESCVSYFRDIRISQGAPCPNCGNQTDKWLPGRKAFQCTECGCSIPLTKGTVMEHSKLFLRTWFYAMHLMTSIKQVLSAKEVQHQLRIEQYPPVWFMMMKLRSIMGKRDSIYQLSEEGELDEAFFPIRLPEEARDKHIDKDTVIVSDDSSSHINFEGYFKDHKQHVEKEVDSVVKPHLPWMSS